LDSSYDIAIVGAGLAGAFAAYSLSNEYRVIVLEKDRAASGASGAGAGLVNPFMARKANPAWMWREALDALESTLSEAGCSSLFKKTGVLRPAVDKRQVEWFKQTASKHPTNSAWLKDGDILTRWPAVGAPFGGLMISDAGSIELDLLVEALLNASTTRGCETRLHTKAIHVREEPSVVLVESDVGQIKARHVILCAGADYVDWSMLSHLPLHPLKGQTIEVKRPDDLKGHLPCLSGSGYVVPYPDRMVLGSTYHHEFENRNPSVADTQTIIDKVSKMLPALDNPDVISTSAGVRVTVPGTRLPLLGPVSDSGRIWVFTGLGSKGVLMGALVGSRMPELVRDPGKIWGEMRFN
jgi:glycine/D-amino acid oxidase-like deaminating enzyme